MIEIPLTRGYVALVDDCDSYVRALTWCTFRPDARRMYAVCNMRNVEGQSRLVYLHCLIMGCKLVDHVSGDGLDCRRANLRPATHAENSQNRRLGRNNTSGFKGVTWNKRARKWQAQLHRRDEMVYLGLFADLSDAARAYDAAAREHFGEFARVNFG